RRRRPPSRLPSPPVHELPRRPPRTTPRTARKDPDRRRLRSAAAPARPRQEPTDRVGTFTASARDRSPPVRNRNRVGRLRPLDTLGRARHDGGAYDRDPRAAGADDRDDVDNDAARAESSD